MSRSELKINCPYCNLLLSSLVLQKSHTTRELHECPHCYEIFIIKTTNILVTTYRLEEHEHYTIEDKPMQELFKPKTTDSHDERSSEDNMRLRDDDQVG